MMMRILGLVKGGRGGSGGSFSGLGGDYDYL